MKKEKQKIFNYDTLWDNFLKGWYYELYYYYHEYMDLPKNEIQKKLLYDKYVEFSEFVLNKYGYEAIGEFLKYCVDDLNNISEEFLEDDDLYNIYKDYSCLYFAYSEFLLLFFYINEIDFYDIFYSI